MLETIQFVPVTHYDVSKEYLINCHILN